MRVGGSLALPLALLIWSSLAAASETCSVTVENHSVTTTCAEEDNLNLALLGSPRFFQIRATHPRYPVTTYACPPDFSGCLPGSPDDYTFQPASLQLYDDGSGVVWAYRQESWWQPAGMTASKLGGPSLADAHYIAVSKKVVDEDSWPQFLVLYQDGNLRLIPHPPEGAASVCFGSSVIVGPADPAARPLAAVDSVIFRPADKVLVIRYVSGGSAQVSMEVDRERATASVAVQYPTSKPFAHLRSMFVDSANCDAERLAVSCAGTTVLDAQALGASGASGDRVLIYRSVASQHNQSAPDIEVWMGGSPEPVPALGLLGMGALGVATILTLLHRGSAGA